MKSLTISRIIPALAASLLLATPTASLAKDKHKHKDNCHSSGRTVVIASPGYSSRSYYSPYHSSYSRPYYSGYSSRDYCAPRTSIGFSLFTSPTYTSSYSSSRYYPSSYSSSSRYTPRASSYSDGLAIDVQRALRRTGHYYGDIDGDIGPESRAAIREYQRDRGLPVTGRIDSSLLRALRIG